MPRVKRTFNMDADNLAVTDSFHDSELIFIHNYTTVLERLVSGLGKPYHAIWRGLFHDAIAYSDYMTSRELPNHTVPRGRLDEIPSGIKRNAELNLELKIKPDEENGKAVREAAIRALCMMDDDEILKRLT